MAGVNDFGDMVGMNDVTAKLGDASVAASDELMAAMDDLENNPDDPSKLINVQMKVGIWSSVTSTASSVYSSIKDMMSGIAQKI